MYHNFKIIAKRIHAGTALLFILFLAEQFKGSIEDIAYVIHENFCHMYDGSLGRSGIFRL